MSAGVRPWKSLPPASGASLKGDTAWDVGHAALEGHDLSFPYLPVVLPIGDDLEGNLARPPGAGRCAAPPRRGGTGAVARRMCRSRILGLVRDNPRERRPGRPRAPGRGRGRSAPGSVCPFLRRPGVASGRRWPPAVPWSPRNRLPPATSSSWSIAGPPRSTRWATSSDHTSSRRRRPSRSPSSWHHQNSTFTAHRRSTGLGPGRKCRTRTAALTPGAVDVRLLTMTPRLEGLPTTTSRPIGPAGPSNSLPTWRCTSPTSLRATDSGRGCSGLRTPTWCSKTLFNTAYAARRAMGVDEDGHPLFPAGTRHGLYQLSPRVTVDVQRAVALALEAKAQTDPDVAIAYSRVVLSLVEGEPLANVLLGYACGRRKATAGASPPCSSTPPAAGRVLASDAGLFDLALVGTRTSTDRRALQRGALQVRHAGGRSRRRRGPSPPGVAQRPTPGSTPARPGRLAPLRRVTESL